MTAVTLELRRLLALAGRGNTEPLRAVVRDALAFREVTDPHELEGRREPLRQTARAAIEDWQEATP